MKKIIIIMFLLNIFKLYAAAPPADDKPLPPPPYALNNVKLITAEVIWNKESLKKFLPEKIINNSKLKGGLTIFNSKEKQEYYPVSGAFTWIELKNKDKLIFFSIYGKNKLINRIMKRVYFSDTELGSNKVTIINNNINVRSNVRKKNVINMSASITSDCNSQKGKDKYLSFKEDRDVYSPLSWDTDKLCEGELKTLTFGSLLEGLQSEKVLSVKVLDGANLLYLSPIVKKNN